MIIAEFVAPDPYRAYTIILEADLDGDGEFEPLTSVVIEQAVQARLAIEAIPGEQPEVSWSGRGTLEFTPSLTFPWSDAPGNPGSPYSVIPLPPGIPFQDMQLFRLRQ